MIFGAWGLNSEEPLGTGLTKWEESPTRIGNDNNWVSISTGYESSFGVKSNGIIFVVVARCNLVMALLWSNNKLTS